MLKVLLILVATSNTVVINPEHNLESTITMLKTKALVCLSQDSLNAITTADAEGKDGHALFLKDEGCGIKCINAQIIRKIKTFRRPDGNNFAVCQVFGFISLWVAAPVDEMGNLHPVNLSDYINFCKN